MIEVKTEKNIKRLIGNANRHFCEVTILGNFVTLFSNEVMTFLNVIERRAVSLRQVSFLAAIILAVEVHRHLVQCTQLREQSSLL